MRYVIVGLIAVIFLWLSSLSVFAQTTEEGWQLYYSDDAGNRYYYDKGGLERPQRNIVKVWQRISQKTRGDEELDTIKMHLQIDCRRKTFETLSYIEYDGTGERVLSAQEYKEKPPKSNLPQDSRMGALLENVCP